MMTKTALIPTVLLLGALLAPPAPAQGQEPHTENTLTLAGAPSPAARLDELSWLTGHWVGTGLGGEAEELWTEPAGGSMAAVFRAVSGGAAQIYEIVWILQVDETLVYRVKHFSADLVGWEDPPETVDFPLVRIEPGAVFFDGLTYRLHEDGTLEAFVAIGRGDEVEEAGFTFRRR